MDRIKLDQARVFGVRGVAGRSGTVISDYISVLVSVTSIPETVMTFRPSHMKHIPVDEIKRFGGPKVGYVFHPHAACCSKRGFVSKSRWAKRRRGRLLGPDARNTWQGTEAPAQPQNFSRICLAYLSGVFSG